MFNSVFITKHLLSFLFIYFITLGGARDELHRKDPSMVFSTFQMNQLGKIRRHHWKQRLKISTIPKL